MTGHYSQRADLPYYRHVKEILESLGELDSILDVGCLDVPTATWGDFRKRYTIDRLKRPVLAGVEAILGSWPEDWTFGSVDVVTCLQVLEHIENPLPFSESLFATAQHTVIVSVPYLWPAGRCKSHVQDPIDEEKLESMTGRTPDRTIIIDCANCRMIAVYVLADERHGTSE